MGNKRARILMAKEKQTGNKAGQMVKALLGTIEAVMLSREQMPMDIRILCDTGSQLNFISEECMQRLRLPRQNAAMALNGIG